MTLDYQIEKSLFLLLDKRSCCSKIVFSLASDWREAQDALKSYYAKNHAQYESHERESSITSELQKEDIIDIGNDEENDSRMSDDDENRLAFETSAPTDDK